MWPDRSDGNTEKQCHCQTDKEELRKESERKGREEGWREGEEEKQGVDRRGDMLRYGAGRTVSTTTTTTTTTEDSPESLSERRIRRLRLTLHAGDDGKNKAKTETSDTAEKEKDVNGVWKKKNGLIQRERPAGRESPQQHLGDMTNGVPESSLQHHGPKVYAVVQRTGSDRRQEVMAREWTVNHLHDEMRYIREVRDSLEKVRERMYGQFGGMQQSMQKLSQELRAVSSHRRSLESEVRIRTAAMDRFDQMNSSLITANIGLQKSLLENCQNRINTRDETKSWQRTCEKTQEKLKDKERELAAAQAENQSLRLQVESSQEANAQALQELSAKLQREYEEKLQEEQRKHREEIENLQAQIDDYIRRLEEAERNIRTAEAKIAERDQRIIEVERLLDCMGKEKSHFQKKLQECEQRLRLMELMDKTDTTVTKRSKELEREVVDLRERIKHLNDMVFCQQRKVKGMIEEVETLRAQVAQKDMFISELLDRIAIVECENRQRESLETREIGVGCDLLPSRFLESKPSVPSGMSSYTYLTENEPSSSPVRSRRDELTVMSSSWTESQGQVGDLRHQSKEQLQELLLRQEKILSNTSDISPSGSSSPSQSSEGSSPLSAQARRERDRKHLDDITAAKLPLLHHSPAQLLSLEESAVLLREQTKKQQELQAKLAAQKLSEGLKISMGSYTPDGGPMAAYREVHDEGAQLSSEED
ncbi:hypothetical protein INR49_024594 [Caranx melampygus]|nr:hypothetical protein INR49_024594 [Caranx melampygus]